MSGNDLPRRSPAKTPENQPDLTDLSISGHRPFKVQAMKSGVPEASPKVQLKLFSIAEVDVNGIQMGVLSDGTPYLNLRSLARLCGVDHAALLRMANNWDEEQSKPRGRKIKELLLARGHSGTQLNVATTDGGVDTHAYTDTVSMAILEYYAFEAVQGSSETALRNYRLLAQQSLRQFIYNQCGYDPNRHIPQSWRNFEERVLLNDQLPIGYFSVFREIADLVIHMIKAGCPLDSHTVPDISVGQAWSSYWLDNGFTTAYGSRLKFPHFYPDWFPQAAVNPVESWIYPANALGLFHTWIHRNYLRQQFPKYVQNKVKKGVFLPARGALLLESLARKELPQQASLPAPKN
jgi:hypothetical protein